MILEALLASDAPADDISAKLAVLIDADNASPAATAGLLAEVARYGTAHVKRAYGDWTGTSLQGWKEQLLAWSIAPMQQFAYASGKNATDSAMIIDAMDLLYTGRFDGFCLVSSDSDFTRLAQRIRESGLTVYGFGQRKTPSSFVKACDKFIYIENLTAPRPAAAPAGRGTAPRPPAGSLPIDAELTALLRSAVETGSDDDGWTHLGYIGSMITKQRPDFDARSYGHAKLSDLFAATGLFELDRRVPHRGKPAVIYARDKQRPA
jgi:NYN domain/OST-HTH/LOTUS domain